MTMMVTSDNATADSFRSHSIFSYKFCDVTEFFIWSRLMIVFARNSEYRAETPPLSKSGQICLPLSGNEPKNKICEKFWAEVIIRLELLQKSP